MRKYGFLGGGEQETVGRVLEQKSGSMPSFVHVHPNETIREAIDILREFDVSQIPVVKAEPPVMIGEIVGAVEESALLDAVFTGKASLSDPVSKHMGAALPMIGSKEPVSAAVSAFESASALTVVDNGKPIGVITRQDLLGYVVS
ncbi:putative cystathionine beta-synthase [mine drainage metagenome]|uniref:Putative cystathionine beta-synthase n=1 Tax=mine drainage metagenome TaxID=410659 RepID=A0A1J5QH13_9ZZZZ